ADHRLVLAEAGVDQHRRVTLREQVAVRNRIAERAAGIGADAAVEGEGVLQDVELALRERGNSAGETVRLASFSGRGLRQYRHDGETLSGLPAEGNRARAHSRAARGAPQMGACCARSSMRAGILARPKRRKTRARWRRPELLLVAWLTEEMGLALF